MLRNSTKCPQMWLWFFRIPWVRKIGDIWRMNTQEGADLRTTMRTRKGWSRAFRILRCYLAKNWVISDTGNVEGQGKDSVRCEMSHKVCSSTELLWVMPVGNKQMVVLWEKGRASPGWWWSRKRAQPGSCARGLEDHSMVSGEKTPESLCEEGGSVVQLPKASGPWRGDPHVGEECNVGLLIENCQLPKKQRICRLAGKRKKKPQGIFF